MSNLLVVDVGNSNVVLGVYHGNKLAGSWRLATARERTADEYGILTRQLVGDAARTLDGAIVSSVVPPLNGAFAGIGRNARSWSSPPDKGIYATTLLTRPVTELPLVPLAIANIVVTYLRDMFSIDARIKWPNDILVDGRKIAGGVLIAELVLLLAECRRDKRAGRERECEPSGDRLLLHGNAPEQE